MLLKKKTKIWRRLLCRVATKSGKSEKFRRNKKKRKHLGKPRKMEVFEKIIGKDRKFDMLFIKKSVINKN